MRVNAGGRAPQCGRLPGVSILIDEGPVCGRTGVSWRSAARVTSTFGALLVEAGDTRRQPVYGRVAADSDRNRLELKGTVMGKYLVRANYVGDGVKGLMEEGGTRRRDAAKAAVESVGGSLESMYFAFGDTDVFGICEFPDDASATAFSLVVNASGAITGSVTPLMSVEDVDAAAAKTPSYRPPGG